MLDYLFGVSPFLPHGFCLTWRPDLLALHIVSDLAIGLAYFSIPVVILAYLRRKPDFEHRGVAWLFAAFIVLCGLTHLMGMITLWWPAYGLDGIIKAVTAVVSVTTAAMLWPLLPRIVTIPSPRALREANARLEREIQERLTAEASLREARDELERRVAERTADLARSEERARLAAAAGNVGLWEWDLTTGTVVRSPQCRAMLDTDDEQPVEGFFERVHPEDQEQVRAAFAEALHKGAIDMEVRILTANGDTRWMDVQGAVYNDVEDETPRRRFLGTIADITDRVRTTEALRESLAEKEVLLTEVHHRVKNNLQSLLALMQLEKRRTGDDALAERFEAMSGRIQVMARVHENLYTSKTLSVVNLGQQVRDLCVSIQQLAPPSGRVRMMVEVEDLYGSLDVAVPLGLLANEVIGNAVKHAFPGERTGTIHVSLRGGEPGAVLTVRDDGVGDPRGEPRAGMGKPLVQVLARQLRATLTVVVETGTTVRVELPRDATQGAPAALVSGPRVSGIGALAT
ncbi:sensor histidine kinase [Roseomonas genomospecies 6]|uniref:histidine kinase n=1 Tax=Roseomonas genomospecies 6 TaxID=214106 RepID=A0A9W7TWM6_9PROT|nr:histidine kinase dimerization/phosphoacceptor domain -containing protein [Roseomonas genomospecies 6]KAA0679502.1 PAS domain S-box protein [Roseomonas genomospecies 6]